MAEANNNPLPRGWIMLSMTDGQGNQKAQAVNVIEKRPGRVCPTELGGDPNCCAVFCADGAEYFVFETVDAVLMKIREATESNGHSATLHS